MEGLERCRRKRKDSDPKPVEWGSEALRPGEGDQKKRVATVAYRFLQIHHIIPNYTRTNPLHLATVMALRERNARPGDGARAKLLRDFHLDATVDLNTAVAQHTRLLQELDTKSRPHRGQWRVLERTLELHHETVWPCILATIATPIIHHHSEAISIITRLLGPLVKGIDYQYRMDDRPSASQHLYELATSQYASIHIKDREAAMAIGRACLGQHFAQPGWAHIPALRKANESAVAILLTGLETESISTCHRDGIDGAWCLVTGAREIYVCSPSEGKRFGLTTVITDPSFKGARHEFQTHPDTTWKKISATAGDWIFMPKDWWHQVYATPGSILLSFYTEAPSHPAYSRQS